MSRDYGSSTLKTTITVPAAFTVVPALPDVLTGIDAFALQLTTPPRVEPLPPPGFVPMYPVFAPAPNRRAELTAHIVSYHNQLVSAGMQLRDAGERVAQSWDQVTVLTRQLAEVRATLAERELSLSAKEQSLSDALHTIARRQADFDTMVRGVMFDADGAL